MIVIYPWMPKELNPNSRTHYMVLAKQKKIYKQACWALTKEAKLPLVDGDRATLEIAFYSPTRARRDLDNCLAAFKAGLDGISEAIGLDDSRFLLAIEMADEIGGYVKVKFTYKGK
jgi:crossover junction endodeoxyribonuclease RusA